MKKKNIDLIMMTYQQNVLKTYTVIQKTGGTDNIIVHRFGCPFMAFRLGKDQLIQITIFTLSLLHLSGTNL